MTQTSRPWFGTVTGDAGPYDQSEWTQIFEGATNSVFANEGVVRQTDPTYKNRELRVEEDSPASADVIVKPGRAFVAGIYYENDADVTFTVPANGTGATRSDLVVLRASWGATQTIRLAYKANTTSLTQTFGTTYEIPIARIDAPNGFSTITQSDIFDYREWCAQDASIFRAANQDASGAAIRTGHIVAWRFGVSANLDVSLSQRAAFAYVILAGVAIGDAPNAGDELSVQSFGICRIKVNSAVSAGDFLGLDPTNRGEASATNFYQRFGVALESGSAGDFILAFVNFNQANQIRLGIYYQSLASGSNGGGLTAATWTGRLFNTTGIQSDPSSIIRLGGGLVRVVSGTYRVRWSAQGYAVNSHQTRLRDTTNGVTLLQGSTAYAPAGVMTESRGAGVFTTTSVIDLQIEHNCGLTNATTGQGLPATTGGNEIYMIIEIEKLSS